MHIQSAELQVRYYENFDLDLSLRKLIALAFISKRNVILAYEQLLHTNFVIETRKLS